MRHITLTLLAVVVAAGTAAGQSIGIVNGIPYNAAPLDTTFSSDLPPGSQEVAGARGFVGRDRDGGFRFQDGRPARFFGTSIEWTGCLPDSATAVVTARHLRKLGINLVRLRYFDHGYAWWDPNLTILDEGNGFLSLHAERMRRFDWFVAQLIANGVYLYLPLQSARVPSADDGLGSNADSALWLDKTLNYLYPSAEGANRRVARAILDHVNPFTGRAYRNEPGIAMLEVAHEGSLLSLYLANYTEHRPGMYGFSWAHSRRLDTLWSDYLLRRYGSTSGVAASWRTAVPDTGGPNLVREGGFEGEFDRYWTPVESDGISVTTILTQTDSVPEGTLAMKLRVRGARGNIFAAYFYQSINLEFGKTYTLSFRAKCTNDTGRRLVVYAVNSEQGAGAGLYATTPITTTWTRYEESFLVPIAATTPTLLVFYLGDLDGDVLLDDVQLRERPLVGLVSGESIEQRNIARIPWGHTANYAVTERRVVDQTDFYLELERGYFDRMRTFIQDSVGARQLTTGASQYYLASAMENDAQGSSDFMSGTGYWDYVYGNEHPWQVINYSQLRADYAGAIYSLAAMTRRNLPFVANFSQPFPNRYQAESMILLPVYALHQKWDGLTFERYTDEGAIRPTLSMDSLRHYDGRYNPVVEAMTPMASLIFRNGLLKPATTTLSIQRTARQIRLLPRLYSQWGYYGVPGGFPGFGSALYGITVDSTNASEFTQLADLGFPATVPGEVLSDTREILWEYGRGSLLLDAPRLQGASGALYRAGGIPLRNFDITLLSTNETATILWASVDSLRTLSAPGRSFMTIVSRTEPTGMRWLDSTHADRWGSAPMLIDPVHVRLTFRPDDSVNVATIQPLDSTGQPLGLPIRSVGHGNGMTVTIDQRITKAAWYAVELSVDRAASTAAAARPEIALAIRPTIVEDRCRIDVVLHRHDIVRIELFDPTGARLAVLHDGHMDPGTTTIAVDASQLPQGLYRVRMVGAEGGIHSGMFTIVR